MAMLQAMRSMIFGPKRVSWPPAQEAGHLRDELQRVLETDFSDQTSRERYGEWVLETLCALEEAISRVQEMARGYPERPVSADVWMTGAEYSTVARALTAHFKEAGWVQREESASGLWAKVTVAVNSHYCHLVGPAMLANADCHRRLLNTERAVELYTSVIKDFVFLMDDWLSEAEAPDDEEGIALECLRLAGECAVELGVREVEGRDLKRLLGDVGRVLSRERREEEPPGY
jgi:hypothetical protein